MAEKILGEVGGLDPGIAGLMSLNGPELRSPPVKVRWRWRGGGLLDPSVPSVVKALSAMTDFDCS